MLRLVVGAKALHLGNPLFQRIPQTQVFDDQLLTQTKEHPASVQEITVLLADMEGFRGVPERLGVNAVPFMTEYFDLMSHHIHAHGGTITKFVVDAVVDFWNTPEHAANACRAA